MEGKGCKVHTKKTGFFGILTMILLCSTMVSGCDRQELIYRFNNVEDASVDNFDENTEVVDNDPTSDTNAMELSTEALSVNDTEMPIDTEETYLGPEVSIVMVGDILLHTPVAESAVQEDGSYNFDAIFSNLSADIQSADLALVNQEVIIGGADIGVSGYPCFNAPYEMGDALVNAGFDVVLHATNHALDQGKKGLTNCLNYWDTTYPDIAVLGINESEEEWQNIYVYEQDGIKIAILNYTYGTNGIALPSGMPYAVNLMEEEKMVSDIQKAKELADFVVVCPHWGTEYKLDIDSWQKKWTDLFLENEVDLVIGTHPHVIEPIEVCVNEETGHEMLVYYSLGNFVNWTSSSGAGIANRMVGGMAEVTLGRDENNEVTILDYGVKALVCHLEEGTNGVSTYALSDYTESLAVKNAIISQDESFSYAYCVELCDSVWGDTWR